VRFFVRTAPEHARSHKRTLNHKHKISFAGALTNMVNLFLYGNRMSGPIPAELTQMSSIVDFRIGFMPGKRAL
jgi:hypothetical protein